MKTHTLLTLLLLSTSCKTETQGYIVNNLNLSLEDIGRDFDGDGEPDNNLDDWTRAWLSLGLDPQAKFDTSLQSGLLSLGLALEIKDRSEDGTVLRAFRATPETRFFDGTDLLTAESEVFSFTGNSFRAKASVFDGPIGLFDGPTNFAVQGERFEWVMIPFDSGVLLPIPLTSVSIEGAIRTNSQGLPEIKSGLLSGLISGRDAARLLEQMPAFFDAQLIKEASAFTGGDPLPCQQVQGAAPECTAINAASLCSDTNEDGVSTGFCVASVSITAAAAAIGLDADGDSRYIVEYDEETETFLRNDLSTLFDLDSPTATPTGLFGDGFFSIDSDQDGLQDAMPVTIGFDSISATLAP